MVGGMVTRKRFRTVLNALALYTIAALVIGYFGVNAYSGNRGLRAKQDLDQQIAQLSGELAALSEPNGDLGTPRLAAAARQHRSRHARRARPGAAQLCRSARIDPAHQATLTAFPRVSGAGLPQARLDAHICPAAKGRARAPIGFRPAAISAIGRRPPHHVSPTTRGEKWPLPVTNQRPSPPRRAERPPSICAGGA